MCGVEHCAREGAGPLYHLSQARGRGAGATSGRARGWPSYRHGNGTLGQQMLPWQYPPLMMAHLDAQ
jgi:hypothetical protein